ncbi:MAG: ribonuclease III [Lachnospiraceae bacterium]|nr:ribonuclease III [Lachnospiraceae bacterium]
MEELTGFQNRIGYAFKDEHLLIHALTHSSYANEKNMERFSDNERLEFLGDAVLELVSSQFLFHHYTDLPEGDLTKLRASLVCEPTLDYCARDIDLPRYIRLGKGEEHTGGRARKSIVSDAMEAVIGAIYLDGGMEPAKAFIEKWILTDIEHKRLFYDSKTTLQEVTQEKYKKTVTYRLVREFGPDHAKQYETEVLLEDQVLGRGTGNSKKAAEQNAAYNALCALHMEDSEKIL